jgi:hypothetical protein
MSGAFYCHSELSSPWGLTLPPLAGYRVAMGALEQDGATFKRIVGDSPGQVRRRAADPLGAFVAAA